MKDVWISHYSEIAGEILSVFHVDRAIGILLANDVLRTNSFCKEDYLDDSNTFYFSVPCDYIFGSDWDEEVVLIDEIQFLYEDWCHHDVYGPIVWIMKKRKCKPIQTIYDSIQELGIWDLNYFEFKNESTGKMYEVKSSSYDPKIKTATICYQEPLGEEFEKVLLNNLNDLYVN